MNGMESLASSSKKTPFTHKKVNKGKNGGCGWMIGCIQEKFMSINIVVLSKNNV